MHVHVKYVVRHNQFRESINFASSNRRTEIEIQVVVQIRDWCKVWKKKTPISSQIIFEQHSTWTCCVLIQLNKPIKTINIIWYH